MDGLPVTIRLIDPPLHEFLPDLTELAVRVAIEDDHHIVDEHDHRLLRGRAAPARAEPDARPARRPPRHRDPRPVRHAGSRDPRGDRRPHQGRWRPAPGDHGAAGRLASTSWPSSAPSSSGGRGCRGGARAHPHRPDRDDDRDPAGRRHRGPDRGLRGLLLVRHQRPDPDDLGLLARRRGGGVLPDVPRPRASSRSRRSSRSTSRASATWCGPRSGWAAQARPDIHLGVCGEHGGDPASIHFFDEVGLDYVSCSPFRVPVARWEAARSARGIAGAGSSA